MQQLRFGGSIEEKKRICVVLVNDCLVSDTIGAKCEGRGNAMGTKGALAVINETAVTTARLRGGKWFAAGRRQGGVAARGGFASHPRTFEDDDAVLDEAEKLGATD